MASMEMSDEEKLDQIMPMAMPARPDFPPSLCIALTERELGKLGCDPTRFKNGDLVHLMQCFARVTNVSHNDGEMGKTCRIELQIENLEIENESVEDEEETEGRSPLHDHKRSR